MTARLRIAISFAGIICLLLININTADAERIAVIGTGYVAGALGPELADLGHEIVYGSRSPDRESVVALVKRTTGNATAVKPKDAVTDAEFVILAVPGLLVDQITRSLGNLDGKIIIDPTNPLVGWEENNVRLQAETSNAEIIQQAAPKALVVKAFSTLNFEQMIHPEKSDGPISIMLAGNDQGAKDKVAKLVTALGLEPIDVGPVESARHVESMVILFLNNRIQGRKSFDFHLRADED